MRTDIYNRGVGGFGQVDMLMMISLGAKQRSLLEFETLIEKSNPRFQLEKASTGGSTELLVVYFRRHASTCQLDLIVDCRQVITSKVGAIIVYEMFHLIVTPKFVKIDLILVMTWMLRRNARRIFGVAPFGSQLRRSEDDM